MDRLFIQRLRDKPENTKLTIIIQYILNSNKHEAFLSIAAQPDTKMTE